jgi:DNA-binding response OmpR family regulator
MSQKRILIVDDEPAIQLLYNEEFTDEGYAVEKAFNGEDGLAIFSRNPPDLVILDINMPGLNGIEVLRRMKEQQPNLPVILNSAYQEFKQDLGAWASDAYVVKSSDMDELKGMVRKLLS